MTSRRNSQAFSSTQSKRNTVNMPSCCTGTGVLPIIVTMLKYYVLQGETILRQMQQQMRELSPALLERLGHWKPVVKKVMDFGKAASEVRPLVCFVVDNRSTTMRTAAPHCKSCGWCRRCHISGMCLQQPRSRNPLTVLRRCLRKRQRRTICCLAWWIV
jgi:hypothetical protein